MIGCSFFLHIALTFTGFTLSWNLFWRSILFQLIYILTLWYLISFMNSSILLQNLLKKYFIKKRMCKDKIIYLPGFLTNLDDGGIVICEILFLVSTIVFLASEMFQMRRLGWYYLKEHENYIQLFVIFSAFLSMFAKPILLGE